MTNLLPCPFCGATAMRVIKFKPTHAPHVKHWVQCSRCFARGPIVYDEQALRVGWNRREREPA